MNFNSFDECINFISSYSRLGAKVIDLSRAEDLMNKIGNPENDLKFVHIAGTNGKGSTLEYIANALELSGYKTGKFTSPYVTHYTDRIRINSREIDEKSLCEICRFVSEKIVSKEYSQFEINMAIAFLWYKKEKCDIVVLETGIGGLLDSTNVIPSPVLSVITSVSLDHTAILGNTVEEIAVQKAGIIKENSAVILSIDNFETTVEIVKNTASAKKSIFIQPEEKNIKYLECGIAGNKFIYKSEKFRTSMIGIHQIANAVTAIEACRYLNTKNFAISEESIKKSLEISKVMARVQYIDGKPPVIVDGGHNPSGITMLSYELNYIKHVLHKKIFTVLGMINSKDYKQGAEIISKHSEKIFCVDGFAENCVNPEILLEIASKYTDAATCNLEDAVKNAKFLALENDNIVLICGSLYLASHYLNNFE